jgi:ribulose-phosphate 3-epimerase
MTFLLSTSILSADFADLAGQLHAVEDGGADWIHIDVMDGAFVPNITMGPFIVETCRRITALPLDVHLMIENPDRHLQAFANAGANYLSVQIEACPHIYKTLQSIRALGCKAGVVLNPGTPASAITEVLPLADLALVMTVNPGFSGQSYIPNMLPKIQTIRTQLDAVNPQAVIEVDGGITAETLPGVYAAGARAIVAATAVFKYPGGIADGIQHLRQSIGH